MTTLKIGQVDSRRVGWRAAVAGLLMLGALPAGAQSLGWITQFGTADYDNAVATTPDGSGGVYVGGTTTGSLGGMNSGESDAWIAHYDSSGSQLWVTQLGTTSGGEVANAAAPDGAGGYTLR